MIVELEQDFGRVVPLLVYVLCLDIFNKKSENGRIVLLTVMWRDVLQVIARKELGVKSGICDLQPGSQSDFFVTASLEEHFTYSATVAKIL